MRVGSYKEACYALRGPGEPSRHVMSLGLKDLLVLYYGFLLLPQISGSRRALRELRKVSSQESASDTSVEARSRSRLGSSGKPNDDPYVILYSKDIGLYIEEFRKFYRYDTLSIIHITISPMVTRPNDDTRSAELSPYLPSVVSGIVPKIDCLWVRVCIYDYKLWVTDLE